MSTAFISTGDCGPTILVRRSGHLAQDKHIGATRSRLHEVVSYWCSHISSPPYRLKAVGAPRPALQLRMRRRMDNAEQHEPPSHGCSAPDNRCGRRPAHTQECNAERILENRKPVWAGTVASGIAGF